MGREKNILDHLGVIVRWRRMIGVCVCAVCLVTAAISLTLPKAYRAHAVVYPPKESQGMSGLSALLGNLPLGLLGMGGAAASATDFMPVIRSERVAEAIARRFELMERYRLETREGLLKTIASRLEVQLSREQFLSISYEDETPELSAEITNAFVDELKRALRERSREQARSLRVYLEERLVRAKAEMDTAEAAYNRFQQEHMAIDLETQAKSQIESAAKLINLLAELSVEREVASRLMAPDNPELRRLDITMSGAEAALDNLLMGHPSADGGRASAEGQLPEIFIPFREVPAIGLKALQLKRDVEIQNAIYQFVRQEYEKARFEEEKESPLVVVLDRAVPPDFRSRPRRTVMVALAGGLSLMVSVLLAFLFEALRGLDEENRSKLDGILGEWRRKR